MTGQTVALRSADARTLEARMNYARAMAESGLLPAQYRKQPANLLWATEYGDTLGLTTIAIVTGIHVIDGKPTASAALMSALVRRAGHRLRIIGDHESATCTIIRSDDPEFHFVVTWTLDDARRAGLINKNVWKQYPGSMLKSRAISQCVRDACEEVLYGMHYTAEELGADQLDEDTVDLESLQRGEATPPPARPAGRPQEDVHDAEIVSPAPATATPAPAEQVPTQRSAARPEQLTPGEYDAVRDLVALVGRISEADALRKEWPNGTRTAWQLVNVRPWLTEEQTGFVPITDGQPIPFGAWFMACGKHLQEHGHSIADALRMANPEPWSEGEHTADPDWDGTDPSDIDHQES